MGAHQCLGAPEIEKRQRCVIVASGVGEPGFEPGKAGPESAVLPLHHTPINKDVRDALSNTTAKVHTFLFSPKGKVAFFAFHRKKRLKDHLSRPFFFRFPPQKKKEYAPTSELEHILFFSFEVHLPLEQYYSATSGSRGH